MIDKLISVLNIEKYFGHNLILSEVSFSIHKGDIVGVIGARGAGKRLLLKLISGHQFPNKGKIIYNGVCINDLNVKKRQKIGIENNILPYKYSLLKRLQYARKEPTWSQRLKDKLYEYGCKDKKDNIDRIASMFRIVGLDTYALNFTNHIFSGGQKQRYQLAELLITKPQLIILDEPFKHFDEFTLDDYIYILKSISSLYSISFLISDRSSLFPSRKYLQNTFFNKCYELKKGKLLPLPQNQDEKRTIVKQKDKYIDSKHIYTRTKEKHIFISYSRTDMESAESIIELLLLNNIHAWIDRKGIEYGSHWDNEVEKAILSCNTMIVLLSPNSVNSRFVSDEYSYALDNNINIFPVLIEDCTIPLRLHRIQYFDYRTINNEVNQKLVEELSKALQRM